jgi:hypothetical protein
MNEEDIIVAGQPLETSEQKPANEILSEDNESLLLQGLSRINEKATKSPEDVLNQMFEKVRLYADLGFTAESKAMLDDAEAYSKSPEYLGSKNSTQTNQQSTDIHMNHEAHGDKKLDPASILSSPL